MRFKRGVVIYRLGPHLQEAMNLVDEAHKDYRGFEVTITSVNEGKHSDDSKHYHRAWDDTRWPKNPFGSQGAFDIRTWTSAWSMVQMSWSAKERLVDYLKLRLDTHFGSDRFLVLPERTHIHIQDNIGDYRGRA